MQMNSALWVFHMKISAYLFDWGDTLMKDIPGRNTKMYTWEHVEAIEGAYDLLKCLSECSKVYIATSAAQSDPGDIEKAFERVGMARYISGYFCKSNVGYTKPSVEFYGVIVGNLGLKPSEIMVVGDSIDNDIVPAGRCGLRTVWFDPWCTPDRDLVPEGTIVIHGLRELIPLQKGEADKKKRW